MTESSPVFILGAQRSGTTLLRLILNAHSKLAIPEEGTFWIPLLRRWRGHLERPLRGRELDSCLEYVERNHQFKLWGIDPGDYYRRLREAGRCTLGELMAGTYRVYAEAHGKTFWGEKSSVFFRMIPVLAELFPEARFIHIVRDGRDVFTSWRKMDPTKANPSVAAIEWVYKIKKARKDLRRMDDSRGYEVRYEALVSEPEPTVRSVCAFLELDFEPEMLDFWKSSDQYIGAHHSDLIFNPVSTKSVGKWRKALSRREIRHFDAIAGGELARHGYEATDRGFLSRDFLFGALPELCLGLPRRAAQVWLTALDLDFSSRLGRATKAAGGGEPPKQNREPAKEEAKS